jgi:hypothetical protein
MKPIAAIVTVALLVLGTSALAQEHPEHPKQDEKQAEQPKAEKKMTLDDLADAITLYIEQDSKLKGGYFLVYDAEEKKPLVLKLDKVHRERLAGLGGGVYFACTDMKSDGGVIYDLDFFMKQTANGIETTDVSVHKKAGKPRYGWKEENGVWKKVKA